MTRRHLSPGDQVAQVFGDWAGIARLPAAHFGAVPQVRGTAVRRDLLGCLHGSGDGRDGTRKGKTAHQMDASRHAVQAAVPRR